MHGMKKDVVVALHSYYQDKVKFFARIAESGCSECEHSNRSMVCHHGGGSFQIPQEVWKKGCPNWQYDEIPFNREVSENLS